MSVIVAERTARAAQVRPVTTFRPDIEGLRAVAVLLVVAFHAGLGIFGGGFVGVDVFFVISGFLITGLLADELWTTGSVSLTAFYARRIRRLLALSAVVLAATAAAAYFVVPVIDRPVVADDIKAAALSFANWHFAADATDYMADVEQSPVLHYWSLSVEEQFYVVWPVLILLVVGRRSGRQRWSVTRNRLFVSLSALGAVSLALSVLTTATTGPWAYFGLHTRAWELAAGGLLALLLPLLPRLPRLVAVLAGYTGLMAVLASAMVFDRATPFPGWAATVPVAGTVLLIAAGGRVQAGVARGLGAPALTYIGRLSYGWYLWHWPCLWLAAAIWGTPAADPELAGSAARSGSGPLATCAAVLISLVLADLTYRWIEQPVRMSRMLSGSRPVTFLFGATVAVAALGVNGFLLEPDPASSAPRAAEPAPGPVGDVVPAMTPAQARADKGAVPGCLVSFAETSADPGCRFGDPAGDRTVVLIGDSHAAHWFPAVNAAAKRNGWQLRFWAKSACAFADVRLRNSQFRREYTECADWRRSVFERIAELPRVDAVVIGRSFSYPTTILDGTGDTVAPDRAAALWGVGAATAFERLARSTRSIIMIRDTPRPGRDVPACLSRHPERSAECAYPRQAHVGLDAPLHREELRSAPLGDAVHYVDFTAEVCPSDPCPVVSAKGTVIFRDHHHLTATFSREVTTAVERALLPHVGSR